VDVLLDGLLQAARLLLTGDGDTWSIIALTLRVSLTATALALLLGVPLGTALALGRFRGRRVLLATANTGMGLPPVVVGLLVTVLLWRSGPLGAFGLLYTPTAMVVAQTLIAAPIVAALTAAALQQVDPNFLLQMRALGATRAWALRALLAEARLPLLAVALAGFGAVVSEVGAAQMVGGNIQGETRVLTTAAVLAPSNAKRDPQRREHQLPEPAGRGPWPSTARGRPPGGRRRRDVGSARSQRRREVDAAAGTRPP
jgi:tungstate transport system permease protein